MPRSSRRKLTTAHRLFLLLYLTGVLISTASSQSLESLRRDFLSPPDDAKLMVRWWWFGTAVEKPEILRELQQMKADGIGGVELAFVYPQVINDPSNGLINYPFVGPEMLDRVKYAQSEARKLGLRVDVTLGSGWPYGGPATTLAQAATRLRITEIPIAANATSVVKPPLEEGESFISAAIVNLRSSTNDPGHCGFAYNNVCGAPAPTAQGRTATPTIKWDANTAKPLDLSGATITLPPSDKPRVALFFIQSHTKQQVKRAAVGAEGWVLDPFSHDAVATHLKAVGEPLVKAFGATPPYAIFSDSLEAYGADWTPTLPAEFQKRRGYDLIPHLPELVAGGTPGAERVRHDWGQTLTELVNQNYLTQINNWAIEHHTKFRSQTYGEPAVDLSSQTLVALPEGEGPHWRAFSTLRWATSGNHLFGNNITSGESFTWLHSPVFRATPLDMKAEADIDFIMGENQLIAHGWPYSPPPSRLQPGDPGWSLYAAAVFNDHNPWHPVMPDVTRYIQRISWLLRQGKPANQVAILLPTDDAWANFVPGKVTVTGEMARLITPELMSAILSAGYNLDFIDAKTINREGIHYPILVIPPTDRIPMDAWQKVLDYAAHGGKVICVGRRPSLDSYGKNLPSSPNKTPPELVADEGKLEEALRATATPDFGLTKTDERTKEVVGFIHRRLPNADIYFVANTSNQEVGAGANFQTTYKNGERWNPETGVVIENKVPAFLAPLELAPYESAIYVFSNAVESRNGAKRSDQGVPTKPHNGDCNCSNTKNPADLSTDWNVTFTSTGKSVNEPTLTDWISSPATLHYSGEAIYSRDFILQATPRTPVYLKIEGGTPNNPNPPNTQQAEPNAPGMPNPLVTRTGPGMRAWYDPPIREAAVVFINGQRAGSLWHPPYQLDITKLLKPGQNRIEIHVYNTAINAWASLPLHDYKPLIEKYGDRFQMQDLDKVKPVPSGILGKIQIIQQSLK